jgi:uncharacterized protein (TIGR00255 family)
MTGFARAEGRSDRYSWTWEVKTVNGRTLDARFRLPQGYDSVEPPARQLVGERLKRGSVAVALQMQAQAAPVTYRVNQGLLTELAGIVRQTEQIIEAAPARLDGLLALRGVLEMVEPEEGEQVRAAREAALLESLVIALDRLIQSRAAEGTRLAGILRGLLYQMAGLVQQARASAATQPDVLRQRLRDQIVAIIEHVPTFPQDRLAQELAILITKGDVREEMDRLDAHIGAARALIDQGDPAGAGRRLDFLSQEFNREANTLCSKSNDVGLTRIGLDLKLAIDRFREQVQNIE